MAGFPHIAVVDDEEAIVDILSYSLKKKFPDAQITGFHNANNAWDWLGANEVDLLLTDLNMPEMNGKEIVSMMEQKSPHTPVIVISGAMTLVELKEMETEYENVRVYAKPLLTRELIEGIELGLAGDNTLSESRIQKLELSNVLHLLHLQRKSVQVTVEHETGSGGVILKSGEPVVVDFNGDMREESFFDLLSLKDPQIKVEASQYAGDVLVTQSFDQLFGEYVRRRDKEQK